MTAPRMARSIKLLKPPAKIKPRQFKLKKSLALKAFFNRAKRMAKIIVTRTKIKRRGKPKPKATPSFSYASIKNTLLEMDSHFAYGYIK